MKFDTIPADYYEYYEVLNLGGHPIETKVEGAKKKEEA
jgi:hypothetical protein